MAQITINVPDNVVNDLLDAFATKFDYNSNKLENETRAQFGRRKLADYAKAIYVEYKDQQSHSVRLSQAETQRQNELTTLNAVQIQ